MERNKRENTNISIPEAIFNTFVFPSPKGIYSIYIFLQRKLPQLFVPVSLGTFFHILLHTLEPKWRFLVQRIATENQILNKMFFNNYLCTFIKFGR